MISNRHQRSSHLAKRKSSFLKVLYLFLLIQVPLSYNFSYAEHPDRERINKLKEELSYKKGNSRIDCLNSLGEEYWWFPRPNPDSIYLYASQANTMALQNNYLQGLARSKLNLGVSEIYRNNYPLAETYLRQSILLSGNIGDIESLGWGYLYLGSILVLNNDYLSAEESFKKATDYFQKAGIDEGKGRLCAYKSSLYTAMGDYEKGFEYCRSSLKIRKQMNDHVCILFSFNNFGNLYKSAGDYEKALDYYSQSLQYAKAHNIIWDENEQLGTIFRYLNNYDSSFYILKESIRDHPKDRNIRLSLGETYLMHKEYDSALSIFQSLINEFRISRDKFHLMSTLLDAGKAYEKKENNITALKFGSEGLSLARQAGNRQTMVDGYQLISNIYHHLGKTDSAFLYLNQYALLKDSLLTKKFHSRLNDYENAAENERKQAQVALLDKDNKIIEQQLNQKTLLNTLLIGGILTLTLLSIIIYRNIYLRRRNETLQYRRKQMDLREQALRSQMNPHFIFNSLNSINRFILQNNKSQASEYLTKFSRLVRFILENSQNPLIPLENEIESLNLYLELESLRFDYHFDYKIILGENLQTGNIQVPPLIIQPFVENAIWHGLMHKEDKGNLVIELKLADDILYCTVTDDGIGRKEALAIKDKSTSTHKSMGMRIPEERIAMLQHKNKQETYIQVTDLLLPDGSIGGTVVLLKIPILNIESRQI